MVSESPNSNLAVVPDAVLSTTQDWADHITGEWRKTVEGIISTGQALIDAKSNLGHGSFGKMFPDSVSPIERPVPFGSRAGRMLMAVTERFSNRKYTSVLPPSWMTLNILTQPDPEIVDDWIDAGKVHPELQQGQAQSLVKSLQEQVPSETPDPPVEAFDTVIGKAVLKVGDFRKRLLELEPESVDLIVTDPPYPKDDLPLWSGLSQVAARLLTPRGICFAYTGQIFLPEVLERMGEHLNYGWTFALLMPSGSQSRIMGRHIMQAWKPVIAFTSNKWPSGEWGNDILIAEGAEKELYEWQQTTGPVQKLIEHYSPPNGLIVDPFLGVGSFGVDAMKSDRRFVGVEIDGGRFKTAVSRLADTHVP